ncbi:MAG TPA: hypothetical protein VGA37_08275 [Gemmatimonadales bacterium]
MKRIVRWAAGFAILALAAACAGDSGPLIRIDGAPVAAGPNVADGAISPENDGIGFAGAADLGFFDDELVVLENRAERIVFFDEQFRATRWIGHEGAGPGELRGPFRMQVFGQRLAVGEINNKRISVFGRDGTFERSYPVPDGRVAFAFAGDEGFYVVSGMPDYYLQVVNDSGAAHPFGGRPVDQYPPDELTRPRLRGLGRELVAMTPDGSVHVFDQLLGAFVRFGPDGIRQQIAKLPRALLEPLRETYRLVLRDFGRPDDDEVSVANALSVTDDGRLLLLFSPVKDRIGLLVDPADYSGREVLIPPDRGDRGRQRGAGAAALHGGRLYLLRLDEVTVHELSGGGS